MKMIIFLLKVREWNIYTLRLSTLKPSEDDIKILMRLFKSIHCTKNEVFYQGFTQKKVKGPSILKTCPFDYVWTLPFFFKSDTAHST